MGQFGQEPGPSQATGMTRVRCILDKFLGVVCHSFPPCLDLPTFAARYLHVRNDARDIRSEMWNHGRERLSGNFAYMPSLFTTLGIFYMLQIYDMGPTALLPLQGYAEIKIRFQSLECYLVAMREFPEGFVIVLNLRFHSW